MYCIGENIIGSYNDDDIYRMNVIDHAIPHKLDESLRKRPVTSPISTMELPPLSSGNGGPKSRSSSVNR